MPGREWKKKKEEEGKKTPHNFAPGIRCLIAAVLRALPSGKRVCMTIYILKTSLFVAVAFDGETTIAPACSLRAIGRAKILLSERSLLGECQTLFSPA